jgi:hypothetical protein
MRQTAHYIEGICNSAAPPQGWLTADKYHSLPVSNPCPDAKADLASLYTGGMTQYADPGVARYLHDSSPEPAIGYGGTKGIFAYYLAVLHFGTLIE